MLEERIDRRYTAYGGAAVLFRCEKKEVLVESGAGTGKAQPLDAIVYTPSGPLPMGFILPGMEVCTPSGAAQVVAVWPQGKQDVYQVEFSTGEIVRCTEDHLWKINCGEVVSTWNLLRGGGQEVPLARLEFREREQEISPYIMGVLLGDGHLRPGLISFSTADDQIYDEVHIGLPPGYKLRPRGKYGFAIGCDGWRPRWRQRRGSVRKRGSRYYASAQVLRERRYFGGFDTREEAQAAIDSRDLTADHRGWWGVIASLGLENSRSWDKFVPELYKYASAEQRLAVLQGLMDTDGTVDRKTGMPSFTTVSRRLAEDVRFLFESLGGLASITEKKTSGRRAYNVWPRYHDNKSLFRLDRKRDLARQRKKRVIRKAVRVTKVGREECQCITVDTPDGLYFTDHAVVTHNSFSVMWRVNHLCRKYPGSRHVFARDKRTALNQSVLPDWEKDVLYHGHPALRGPRRTHRESYIYPNGSEVILHSLENVDRILSAQFDTINIFQAEELQDEDVWESLTTRLRYGRMPFGQIVADVNPSAAAHWLNVRADRKICTPCLHGVGRPEGMPTVIEMDEAEGKPICPLCKGRVWEYQMQRILYRHEDNPLWYDQNKKKWTKQGKEYIGNTLGRLTGVNRERLLKHRWVSESGVILDEYDPKVHLLEGSLVEPGKDINNPDSPNWTLYVNGWAKPVNLVKFGAGVDWGFYPDPGVITVWGYDEQWRRFLVEEVYHTRKQIEWWADVADELRKKYDIAYFACDPSRPDYREMFNIRMMTRFGRSGRQIAVKADNRLRSKPKAQGKDLAGIDLMRWGLRDPDGEVRTYFLKETNRGWGIDTAMRKANRPVSTTQEILQWVWAKDSDGKDLGKPDPKCDDHGLDSFRYEMSIGWLGRHEERQEEKGPKPGSIRALLWSQYKDY